MRYKDGKVYIKDESITSIDYSGKGSYYKFVSDNSKNGYYQVIISSEIMISLLKYYYLERKFDIVNIEFMVEDDSNSDILQYIQLSNTNREYFNLLIDKLDFLNTNTSIEIKRIEMKYHSRSKDIMVYFQVNGIYGVNIESYMEESKNILEIIEREIL